MFRSTAAVLASSCVVALIAATGPAITPAAADTGPSKAQVNAAVKAYASQIQAGYLSKLPANGRVAGLARATATQTSLAREISTADVKLLTGAGDPINSATVSTKLLSTKTSSSGIITADVSMTTTVDQGPDGDGVDEPSSWTDTHRLTLANDAGLLSVTADSNMPGPSEPAPTKAELAEPLPQGWSKPHPVSSVRPTQLSANTASNRGSSGVITPQALTPGFPAESKINADKFRAYALKWTASPYDGDAKSDYNSTYPVYNNNCANFASQTLDQAGWYLTGGNSLQVEDDTKWTYNLAGVAGATRTWSLSRKLMLFAFNTGTYDDKVSSIWAVRKGDLLFADWEGPQGVGHPDGTVDHTMVVTGFAADNGEPLISQKTNNRHHIRLSQSIQIAKDQGRYPIVWYALRHL